MMAIAARIAVLVCIILVGMQTAGLIAARNDATLNVSGEVTQSGANSTSGRQLPAIRRPNPAAASQTLTRPLFFPGRTIPSPPAKSPPPSTEIAAQPQVEAPKQLTAVLKLHGVLWASTGWRALIRVEQLEPQWLQVGDEIGGWTLTDVQADHAVLRSHQGTKTLALHPLRQDN